MSLVEINGLYKSFGSKAVIRGLNFAVPEGAIYGFLGQNGAGKTTVMKMLLGLLKADSGKMNICGEPVFYGETKTNRFVGFLPDVPEFYGYMRPKEYLHLCGEITGMQKKVIRRRSEELLSLVGLDKAARKIGGFSRGMKQRLGIAQALLNEPKLLICDEPTSALDPIGRKEILDILASVKGKTTILFSTHILSDVERICDRAAVLHQGKLVLDGALEDLKAKGGHRGIAVEFASEQDMKRIAQDEAAGRLFPKAGLKGRTAVLTVPDSEEARARLYNAFSACRVYPEKVEVLEQSLEDLFLKAIDAKKGGEQQ